MIRLAAAAVVFVFLAATFARADFYKWTDRDGREFFTNDRAKIPAEYRAQARPVEVRDDRVSVGTNSAATPVRDARDTQVVEHKDKYGRGEEYWRKRATNLRRELRKLEDDHERVVKQLGEREQSVAQAGKKPKKKGLSGLKKKRTKLEKDIARKKHELEVELPDEARKADAYPGWLRE